MILQRLDLGIHMVDTVLARTTNSNRRRNITLALVSLVFLGVVAVGFASPAVASIGHGGESADLASVDQGQVIDSPGIGPVPHLSYDGNVSIPAAAEEQAEWGIFPTDNEVEVANDTVFVYITGQDIGGETSWWEFARDGNITGFEFDVRWDPRILQLESVEPTAGAIRLSNEENDDFNWEEFNPGVIEVEWDLQMTLAEIIGAMFSDDGPDDPFPGFDDDDLFRLEFSPTAMAEPGDFTFISVGHHTDRSGGFCEAGKVRGGIPYDLWDITDYKNENTWCGEGAVEVVPESNEPAIEGAIGSFTATSNGGYIAFGEDSDPGSGDALAEFPSPGDGDRLIHIEGDYNEDGDWRAKPGDVTFPDIEAGENDVPASVNINEPIEGTIDTENNTMSMETTFEVEVDVLGEDFTFEFNASEGESGNLAGHADLDVDPDSLDGSGYATLVDNEFVVLEENQDGLDQLPGEAGLERGGDWIADEEGVNYVVFNWDLVFEEFSGDEGALVGTVIDADSDVPIENASVDVVGQPGTDTLTNSVGGFGIEGIDPGEWEMHVNAEGYEPLEQTVEIEALETVEQSFQLTEGESNFDVEVETNEEVIEGDVLPVRTTVENTGTGIDEQEIALHIDGETVATETVELGTAVEDDLTPAPLSHQETINFEWEADSVGDVEVEVTTADDSDSTDVTVIDEDDVQIDMLITAESTEGGWISFAEEEETAHDEGLGLPPGGNETEDRAGDSILIEGTVSDDTWRSIRVDFPELSVAGFVAEITTPFGLSGEYDPENDRMTVEGTLEVGVVDDGEVLGSFAFDIAATTDGSGALDGEGTLGNESGTVVTVDNEYIIEDETGTALDNVVGLPADTEGENWVELRFDITSEEVDGDLDFGDVEGVVTGPAGDPVEGASVELGEDYETRTDEDGEYELNLIDAGSYELTVDADGYSETSVEVEVESDETLVKDVELAAGQPEFELDVSGDFVTVGETVEVEGTVENVGDGPGSTEVTLSVAEESQTETVELDVGESAVILLEWETDEDDVDQYNATLETDDDSATDEVVVEEEVDGAGADERLTATSAGGWISFTEETEDAAFDGSLAFPAEGEDAEYIEIVGLIEDGEWYSTDVRFPALDVPEMPLIAEVSAPRGLGGEYNPEEGYMTVEGEFEVDVEGNSFAFEIDATTDDSGALSGEWTPDSVTVVDNQYIIPDESGEALLDGTLGLPAMDPGENWFELALNFEVEELDEPIRDDSGTIEGVVTTTDGDPIEGATVGGDGVSAEATTGADGTYELSISAGSYDLEIDAPEYTPETESIEVSAGETTELDAALEPGEPEFETSIGDVTAEDGQPVEVTGEVTNVGTATDMADVTLEVGDEIVEKTVEIAPGESEMVTATVDLDTDEVEAVMSVGEATTSASVAISDEGSGENTFTIESTGGWVSFDEAAEGEAREEGLEFPPHEDDDSTIFIAGEILEDGTWQSTQTVFPTLAVSDQIQADIESPGLGGEIDIETGYMTLEGTLEVHVGDDSFAFEIEAETGESGALSGSASIDEDGGEVSFVDNEFIVDDESGSALVDGVVGLPATESGENWFALDVEVDFDGDDSEAAERAAENDDDDEAPSAGSFVASLGQLVGLLGLGTATVLVFVGMATRFISAVDPDPES